MSDTPSTIAKPFDPVAHAVLAGTTPAVPAKEDEREFPMARLSRGSSVAMVGGMMSQGLKFLTVITIARQFSTAEFGYFSFTVALNAFIFMIGHFGLPMYGSREVARTECVSLRLLTSIALSRALLALVATLVALGVLRLIPRVTSEEHSLVMWFGLSNVCLAGLFDWAFQGLHRQDIAAALNVVWQMGWLFFVVAGTWLKAGITIAGIGLFFSALLAAAVGVLWLVVSGTVTKVDWRASSVLADSWQILRSGSALGAGTLLVTILVWTDTVMVRLLQGEQGVALYAAGNRAALALAMLASFYVQGAFPVLSMGASIPGPRFNKYFQHSYRDMAIVFLPGVIWAMVYAPEIMRVLFKRPEFLAALSTFRVFQVVFLLTALANLYGIGGLVAFRRDREYRSALVLVSALFVPMCVFATYYLGILGAALAALTAQGLLLWRLMRVTRTYVNVKHGSTVLLPIAVGLAAGWIGKVGGLTVFWSGALLLVGYAGLIWARFKTIRREGYAA